MADRSEMARNVIQSEFRTSKMTESSHFVKNFQKKIKKVAYRSEMARNASDLNNVRTDCWLTTTWYQYIYIYIQTAMLGTREYTLCSPFRANAHNSSCHCHCTTGMMCVQYGDYRPNTYLIGAKETC